MSACAPLDALVGLTFDPSTHTNYNSAPNSVFFLGYNNLHKGFKYLDVVEGRVYISRDVVFDETIFPFHKLNPNAGARLRAEILLLPSTSQGHATGDEFMDDPMTDMLINHVATNPVCPAAASKKNPTKIMQD
jgi:hypothetical protein